MYRIASLALALFSLLAAAPQVPVPSATPAVSPAPSPTASPSVAPTPLPTPVVLPNDAPPRIVAIATSSTVVHSGDTFSATVITSTNVAAVEVRLFGHAMRLTRTDPGVWQLAHVVPYVPFWMRKTYTADIVAINAAGEEATQQITVSVR